MQEKITSATPSGVVFFTENEDYEKALSEIKAVADTAKRYSMLFELAQQCQQNGFERRAADLYRTIIVDGGIAEYRNRPTSVAGMLALKSYKALIALSCSHDECVWEECSQLTADVRHIFE